MWLSIVLFIAAGLLEIGGGALVWRLWRDGAPWWLGAAGCAALAAYGVVPTYQAPHFSRVYAAYGGVFIVLSLLWGWGVDGVLPDPARHRRRAPLRRWCGPDHVRTQMTGTISA